LYVLYDMMGPKLMSLVWIKSWIMVGWILGWDCYAW